MAIAGEPNRERRAEQARPVGGGLSLACWPQQRTHQVPFNPGFIVDISPPPAPPAPVAMAAYADENIVVTGQRMARAEMAAPVAVMVADQEDLGDLKLYRVPEPVTVNAKGQKQVAMIVKPGAAFDRIYTVRVDEYGRNDGASMPMSILFRGSNRKEKGLGLPMPSGQVMLFEDSNYGPLLAGQSTLSDRAVGDEIEMIVGRSSDVRYAVTRMSETVEKQRFKVDITNARSEPVNVEVEIPFELRGKPKHIAKVDGIPTWKATIAANGEATLYYELELEKN
jgi:hypothetical protein